MPLDAIDSVWPIIPATDVASSDLLRVYGPGNPDVVFVRASGISTISISNMAELYLTTPQADLIYLLRGYYTDGDGGEGEFYTITGEAPGTFTDNGGTTIVPTGGDGSAAFFRRYTEGIVSVPWFGGIPDGSMDCIDAIERALSTLTVSTLVSGIIRFPSTPYATENRKWYSISRAIEIGDGSTLSIALTIDGVLPANPMEQQAIATASIRTTSLTDDVIRVLPKPNSTSQLSIINLCIDAWDSVASGLFIDGNQMAALSMYNCQLIWGGYGLRVNSNLVSPNFNLVSWHRNTIASMWIEDEIDNGVWDQCVFQSGDLDAVKISGNGFIIGSMFFGCVMEAYGRHIFYFDTGAANPLQNVTFDCIWFEALADTVFHVTADAKGVSFVKFQNLHMANNVVDPVDFFRTVSGASNVSQYLFFTDCFFANMGTAKILSVDTDPTTSSMGGYQYVSMTNSWYPDMEFPTGCYPPALTGANPVQFIGFIPAVNTHFSQQPEYIYNSDFYTNVTFQQQIYLPGLPTADPANGLSQVWCDTAAGRVLKLGT